MLYRRSQPVSACIGKPGSRYSQTRLLTMRIYNDVSAVNLAFKLCGPCFGLSRGCVYKTDINGVKLRTRDLKVDTPVSKVASILLGVESVWRTRPVCEFYETT